jgi:uncharacterized protein (TIGR03083 family)
MPGAVTAGPPRSSPAGPTPAWTRAWSGRAGRPLTSRARSGGLRLAESPLTLLAAVDAVGPGTEASTFLGPRPASWWVRRRLHEATVHRADAAIALGGPYQLPAELAADGISEWLERLADEQALGQPPSLPAGASLALQATDQDLTESTWTVLGRPEGVQWTGRAGSADLTLSGPATDLLLALLRRRPVEDTGISLPGNTELRPTHNAMTGTGDEAVQRDDSKPAGRDCRWRRRAGSRARPRIARRAREPARTLPLSRRRRCRQ